MSPFALKICADGENSQGRLIARRFIGWLLVCAALCLPPAAPAQRPPIQPPSAEKPWPRVGFEQILDGRKTMPTLGHTSGEDGDLLAYLTHAGDGSNRLFILERLGKIWIMQDGQLLPSPFLDITRLTDIRLEHGLLCLAFPPDAKAKDHFYIFYTDLGGNPTLARYKVDPKDKNRALTDSGEVLLTVPHPRYINHQGGQIAFGKDGLLYMSLGDGGGQYDATRNAQRLTSHLGKILRLDVEGKPDAGKPYHVPPDNPFVKTPGARPEIWALGLRNPWRFSFDRENGDFYLSVVGERRSESIYYLPANHKGGANFGWSIYEGTFSLYPDEKPGTDGGFTFPAVEFSRTAGSSFSSIIGGYVYRGRQYPAWQGFYFFSDWVTCEIWAARRDTDGHWQTRQVDGGHSPVDQPVSFGEDEPGNLYIMSFGDGKIYRLIERPEGK